MFLLSNLILYIAANNSNNRDQPNHILNIINEISATEIEPGTYVYKYSSQTLNYDGYTPSMMDGLMLNVMYIYIHQV